MKLPSSNFILLGVLLIVSTLLVSNDVVLGLARELQPERPAGGSPLSDDNQKQAVELVAAPNGTVFLMVSDSRKVLWSFPSGPPIYSSYQAPLPQDSEKDNAEVPSRYSFIDCGDDWALYLNYQNGKKKLKDTIQDYVKDTPISEDDEVIVGSMHSTVLKVDFRSGRLIHDYGKYVSLNISRSGEDHQSAESRKKSESSVSLSAKGSNEELYIERTDYSLSTKAFDKPLWNLTIGSFKAKLRCKGTKHLPNGASSTLGLKLGSGLNARGSFSWSCGSEFPVRRFRKQSMFDSFIGLDGRSNMLSADGPSQKLPLSSMGIESSVTNKARLSSATRTLLRREALEISTRAHSHRVGGISVLKSYVPWSFVLLAVLLVGYALYQKAVAAKVEVNGECFASSSRPLPSKGKKSSKSGKGVINKEARDSENVVRGCWNLNSLVQDERGGRIIGNLSLSHREIAKGSNGTVVYEGVREGRKVAAKRLVRAHHEEVAYKEIENLLASDQHPNVVRLYGVESDRDFVYISLERCLCNLNDLIELYADDSSSSTFSDGKAPSAIAEHQRRLDLVKVTIGDIRLWKSNGYPSPLLLKLMRDMVSGLVHLHDLGIIHRDIKPQNVLVSKGRVLCAKLSDMGISKLLPADSSSLGHRATGNGSSGWQAPEQLLHERQTRAMDMFSLGCVLYYCVTGGWHPFGERLERDSNIIKNQKDLSWVDYIPEAVELFSRLLNPDPQMRPKALEVLHHPFFWDAETRLSFLCASSNRVELLDRVAGSDTLKSLESIAPKTIGTNWGVKLEPAFINNLGQYRRYKYDSVRDLLRVIRNKFNHYQELPAEIQGLLGPVPHGFDEYFRSRYPKLLIEVYKVMHKFCRAEEWFQKYL